MTDPTLTLPMTRERHRLDRTFLSDTALFVLIRVATLFVVSPIANFPLLDDWSFGRTTQRFVESWDYHPVGFGVMTLATNVIWGALFCIPDGFSFTALRISTLFASVLGMVGVNILAREFGLPRWAGLVMALALAFDPFYYTLSYTFMTDVLFTTLIVWSVIFFIRAMSDNSNKAMMVAIILAAVATLSRQLALCVPIAFAAVVLLTSRRSLSALLRALTPLIACVCVLFSFTYWLRVTGRTPLHWGSFDSDLLQNLSDPKKLAGLVVDHTSYALWNLGLIMIPLVPAFVPGLFNTVKSRRINALLFGVLVVGISIGLRAYFKYSLVLPAHDNVLVKSGIGPMMLLDLFDLKLNNMQALPESFWIIVSMLSAASAAIVLAALYAMSASIGLSLFQKRDLTSQDVSRLFLEVSCGVYLLLLLPSPFFFDRYVILMLPLLGVSLISFSWPSGRPFLERIPSSGVLCLGLIALFGLYSVLGTRDYLAWNRVRWVALRDLVDNKRINPHDIDGGFEFDGFYDYDPADSPKRGWVGYPDQYVLAFGPIPGYTTVTQYSYYHWMPPHLQNVVIVKKDSSP